MGDFGAIYNETTPSTIKASKDGVCYRCGREKKEIEAILNKVLSNISSRMNRRQKVDPREEYKNRLIIDCSWAMLNPKLPPQPKGKFCAGFIMAGGASPHSSSDSSSSHSPSDSSSDIESSWGPNSGTILAGYLVLGGGIFSLEGLCATGWTIL